ncbi:MAG: hypothetical protein IPK33_25650 [Gemmatimonadetes bacterium]|nr:hypothetical protein [Gemmatimonadota bacterium]
MAQGRARNDPAFPTATLEWRRENLTSPLQPDIFGTLQIPLKRDRTALGSAIGPTRAGRAWAKAESTAVARQIEET